MNIGDFLERFMGSSLERPRLEEVPLCAPDFVWGREQKQQNESERGGLTAFVFLEMRHLFEWGKSTEPC